MRISKVLAFLFVLFLPSSFVSADWVWSPEQGKFINTQEDTQTDAEDLFETALDLYKEKDLDKAIEQFELVLKKYPKSRFAPEAEYRLGTLYEESSDYVKAHKAYQSLIKSYPQSERFDEVIEREYQIGMIFLSGKKGKLMGLEIRPSLPLAIEVFQKIVEAAPYGTFGDKAQFNLGVAYQRSRRYDEAVEAYQTLIDQYPKSELVQQARLQMTEASFEKSSVETLDQSALDAAARQAQGYLQRYPDSEDAAKALEIRNQVDSLNAEKNYRIGLYYEKDNYLESALIYYRDTAKRYPETAWGKKAAEKLSALEEPVKYLNSKTDELETQLSGLRTQHDALGKDQKAERDRLKGEIALLEKRIKVIDKNKAESLNRRKQDLKRREQELKEKFKELERKKKRYKDNTSEDFQKAIARWQASLEAERDMLAEERGKLDSWRSELGIADQKFYEALIPFKGHPETALEKIRKIDERELYKASRKKKEILAEKEKLYKRYSELQSLLAPFVPQRSATGLLKKRLRGIEPRDPSQPADPKLVAREEEIRSLESKLDEKKAAYEKSFGKMAELELEALIEGRVAGPASPGAMSLPDPDIKTKSLEELLVLKMHLTEEIATQRNIVETLSTAFDREMALQEQRRMIASLEGDQDVDERKLRKEIKGVEKEIRTRYQDIQDRHKRKTRLLEEVDAALQPREAGNKTLKTIAKPVTGSYRLAKAFLLGLPHEDVELARAKPPVDGGRVAKLQQAIELESLMIEAQDLEIGKLEKQLEILNAKASLAGGVKFRSSFVKVPYEFIGEAIQSARRIVPRKDRKAVLLNRLDQQTKELDALKQKLDITDALIKERTPSVTPTEGAANVQAAGTAEDQAAEEKSLRDEIIRLQEQLEIAYSAYAREQGIVLGDATQAEPADGTKEAEYYRELEHLRGKLVGLIDEELVIEGQERAVLEKRVQEADKVLPSVTSKAMSQDLLTEKGRMAQRLADLATRRDFLEQEKARFGVQS
ncbi:MAG: outer membrane protein assembly factor BamD [Candidatus Omnitrophica bacterium]|nr:outer membrane protein assembly factor BamD [Candidatus Omnitrophota bacterium]